MRIRFAGDDAAVDGDRRATWRGRLARGRIARLRGRSGRSSTRIVDAHDLDDADAGRERPPPTPLAPVTLRWIAVHLIEELARHAGHADILRELLDGDTGR